MEADTKSQMKTKQSPTCYQTSQWRKRQLQSAGGLDGGQGSATWREEAESTRKPPLLALAFPRGSNAHGGGSAGTRVTLPPPGGNCSRHRLVWVLVSSGTSGRGPPNTLCPEDRVHRRTLAQSRQGKQFLRPFRGGLAGPPEQEPLERDPRRVGCWSRAATPPRWGCLRLFGRVYSATTRRSWRRAELCVNQPGLATPTTQTSPGWETRP